MTLFRGKLAVGQELIISKFHLHQCHLNLHEEVLVRECFQPLVVLI
jgi:hypothetical protein